MDCPLKFDFVLKKKKRREKRIIKEIKEKCLKQGCLLIFLL